MYVQIMLSLFKVAEWSPFGKELLTKLIISSLFNIYMFICKNFTYFPFWFEVKNLGSDCTSSWPLLSFYSFFY